MISYIHADYIKKEVGMYPWLYECHVLLSSVDKGANALSTGYFGVYLDVIRGHIKYLLPASMANLLEV